MVLRGAPYPELVGHGSELSRHALDGTRGGDSAMLSRSYGVFCDSRCSPTEREFQAQANLQTDHIEVNDEPWVHRLASHAVSGLS